MDTLLELGARFIGYLLAEIIFGTLFYWLGWPWVKLLSLGQYPRQRWGSGTREETYVACVGGCFSALALMAALGQF